MTNKPKCPFKKFKPCIGKDCALFMPGKHLVDPFKIKIGSFELDVQPQHINTDLCSLLLSGMLIADLHSIITSAFMKFK